MMRPAERTPLGIRVHGLSNSAGQERQVRMRAGSKLGKFTLQRGSAFRQAGERKP